MEKINEGENTVVNEQEEHMESINEGENTVVNEEESYFGVCPTCHKEDGYINVGKGHWGICEEHRVMWYFGSNLLSSWRNQTEEEQRRVWDELSLETFTKVEPAGDGSGRLIPSLRRSRA